jgi:agmatine/peptidylarginine deiminase
MKKLFPFIILFILNPEVKAQDLPHWLTQEEKQALPGYLLNQNNFLRGTEPPSFAPRTMAEWEEISGLLITWTSYTGILHQIVDYAQEECTVYIVCTDSNSVKSNLTSNGVPVFNIKFLEQDFNSVWSRDYGQWSIYKDDVNELSLADWIYNRPRPKDDVIPGALATFMGIPIYEMTASPDDLVHTGGNFMVDGHGTGFSSNLMLEENGLYNDFGATVKTKAEIDTIMKKYLGLNRYILMETLPNDVIHHIDMHMKLLDEETLLWSEFPLGVSDGPQIEENLQYVQDNFLNCYNRPYKIVRIPMAPSTSGKYPPQADYRTYANSVFINKTVLVPTYREEFDTTALRIYKENLPGYNVIGIDCDDNGGNIISALGALHCITKEIGHSDPIRIDHATLQDTVAFSGPFEIVAKIQTPSGVLAATLYWTIDTAVGFSAVTMTPMANDSFFAEIPLQPNTSLVYYYIHAESNSGRSASKPLTAPKGWMRFRISNFSGLHEQSASLVVYEPYPNPSSNSVNFGFELPGAMHCRLYVTDVAGKILFTVEDQQLQSGPHKYPIASGNLCNGIYLLNLETEDQLWQKKLMVAH